MQLQRPVSHDVGAYTDLNRLNKLKVGEERDSEENIRKVAQEFESLFINEMLKAMRSANDVLADDNLFNTNESKTYRDMHDQQLAVTMAQGKGIGLADTLVRQMTEMNQPRPQANPFPDMQPKTQTGQPEQQEQAMSGLRRNTALSSYQQVQGQQPDGPASFASPQEFVSSMLPMAQKAARRLGVEPQYLVAQAALETGWGQKMLQDAKGNNTHNLFGIKAHGWQGQAAMANTSEYVNGNKQSERAQFRQYDSYAQSFDDYVNFLTSNPRYQKALRSAADPQQYVRELQQAGYATDPNYADKIRHIAEQMQKFPQQAQLSADTVAIRG